jgi:hypothetical protein
MSSAIVPFFASSFSAEDSISVLQCGQEHLKFVLKNSQQEGIFL